MIEIHCRGCGDVMAFSQSAAGKIATCPMCGTSNKVPDVDLGGVSQGRPYTTEARPQAPSRRHGPIPATAVQSTAPNCQEAKTDTYELKPPAAAAPVPPMPAQILPPDLADLWAAVDWYRRSSFVSILVLLGVFCCGPLTLIPACLIVFTGPVFYNSLNHDGSLREWHPANKWVALALLLAFVTAMVAYVIYHNPVVS